MSTADISTPVVTLRDGLINVIDMNLDHGRLYEVAADWNSADADAAIDFHLRRLDAHEKSKARALAAADEFRVKAGLTLTVDMARVLVDRLNQHIDAAEAVA